MFGLGKDKAKKQGGLSDLQEVITNVIMTQMSLGSAGTPEGQKRLMTPYGCGYIFGFADAMVGYAGVKKDVEVIAQLTISHINLFGEDRGSKVFRLALDLQSDPEFAAGRTLGGSEAIDWLRNNQKIPMGLAEWLNGKAPI